MKNELLNKIFPDLETIRSTSFFEKQYPERNLQTGSMVTRFAPSPTGFMHIGGIYTALINKIMAVQTGGLFYLRVEDTDSLRSQEATIPIIIDALRKFELYPDEGLTSSNETVVGNYGPYIQSLRKEIYTSYVIYLMVKGLAYPCFLSTKEIDNIRVEQSRRKLKIGCYGEWSKWRDASENDILSQLENNTSFVIRIKSTGCSANQIKWHDLVKGDISMPENDNDIIILKSDGLPTYHFAHVIDDFLMRTTHVIRGDEWLPSVPVHLQLFKIFGWIPPHYAHIAPIEKLDEQSNFTSRRKLSKRKDEDANINFYLENGFPTNAIIDYLYNLMDSSYLEKKSANPNDIFKFNLNKMSKHGALNDLDKLRSLSQETISRMNIDTLYNCSLEWASQWDRDLANFMMKYLSYTKQALNIERDGDRPSKRFVTWKDIRLQIGFFYDEIFNKIAVHNFELNINALDANSIINDFIKNYNVSWSKFEWLSYIKSIANKYGYAESLKIYKLHSVKYKGHYGDVVRLIRLGVCGVEQSPDLWEVMRVMGQGRVVSRLKKLLDRLLYANSSVV